MFYILMTQALPGWQRLPMYKLLFFGRGSVFPSKSLARPVYRLRKGYVGLGYVRRGTDKRETVANCACQPLESQRFSYFRCTLYCGCVILCERLR